MVPGYNYSHSRKGTNSSGQPSNWEQLPLAKPDALSSGDGQETATESHQKNKEEDARRGGKKE